MILRLTILLAALATAGAAFGGEIYRYEAPDGSLAFTDSTKRIPAAATAIQTVKPTDARWTYAEPARPQHRWPGQPNLYEAEQAARWATQAEGARRAIEDADAVKVLADELRVGQGAAALHAEQARRRAERLEDACRTSGGCQPGFVRVP